MSAPHISPVYLGCLWMSTCMTYLSAPRISPGKYAFSRVVRSRRCRTSGTRSRLSRPALGGASVSTSPQGGGHVWLRCGPQTIWGAPYGVGQVSHHPLPCDHSAGGHPLQHRCVRDEVPEQAVRTIPESEAGGVEAGAWSLRRIGDDQHGRAACTGNVQGHGTHRAGFAAGGTYGVASQAALSSSKVPSDRRSGSRADAQVAG